MVDAVDQKYPYQKYDVLLYFLFSKFFKYFTYFIMQSNSIIPAGKWEADSWRGDRLNCATVLGYGVAVLPNTDAMIKFGSTRSIIK